jgi:small subunit ribosomal protein S15
MDQVKTVNKQAIFNEYGKSESNTGSIEGQIALFTNRIQHISEHLKANRKDHSSRRSLLKMVGKRKRLLQYLAKSDLDGYRKLLEKLNLRK